MEDEKNEKADVEKKEIVLISKGYAVIEAFLKVELDLNDEKWEDLRCETGDEMECTYTIDENNTVIVKEMKFPKLYSGRVHVSSKESIVEVVPSSTYPSGKCERVRVDKKQKNSICHMLYNFGASFYMLIVLWKAEESSKKEINPREGDIIKFRLRFVNNEWHPKDLKIAPHNPPFCFFFLLKKMYTII
ncbi:hypothetical protein RFI_29713 [Reticulomyxa filosa]|uniref:Uncharacterized protein n=1 Tax=Reticulomyxa filosa TaxID=46433 RepID=X6M3S2_RETFI|nr:hypothetical protein RFI_29713 [Reticulomyxa filosa]|eukprot:ETO07675.1 hypothetical protein RFI_29713 [Reticulomyxa filosa]